MRELCECDKAVREKVNRFNSVKESTVGKKLTEDGVVFTEACLKGILNGYSFSREELEEFYWALVSDSSLPLIKAFGKLGFVKECRIEYIVEEHLGEAFKMTEDKFWSCNWDWPSKMMEDSKGYEKRVREFYKFVTKNFPEPAFGAYL